MARKALIVIDMLNDFLDEKGVLYCGPSSRMIIPFIQERLNVYRERGNQVIFLQDSHDVDDLEFEKFPKHSVTGTWGHAFIPELQPLAGETVLAKKRYSGFYQTGLAEVLKATGAETVEVVGVCTSICVMDTVGGLVNRDYRVTVPASGVADFDDAAHVFALKRMATVYGVEIK